VTVQRKVTPEGKVRYRARIKANGREVASRMFDRKSDAVAWEQDQRRRLRAGEWLDPRRGQMPLSVVAEMWLESRRTAKRRTLESDRGAWRNYIAPRFGRRPVASITTADVSSWLGDLMRRGLARSTVTRALATLRSLLSFAVADGRVTVNAAGAAKAPTGGQARREGSFLDLDEVVALAQALTRNWSTYSRYKAFGGVNWPACRCGTGSWCPAQGCGCRGRF
jgi:Phage integrase central domain